MINSIHTNKFTKKRLDLVNKKKSISQIERDCAIDNFLNENDDRKDKNTLHYPTFENSIVDLSILSESNENFDVAASESRKTNDIQKHVSASHVKPECSGLIVLQANVKTCKTNLTRPAMNHSELIKRKGREKNTWKNQSYCRKEGKQQCL